MNEAEKKPKVTLEDLLQLKRAERPADDFWPRFEEELRAKQLAALVQPVKPWWHGLLGRRMLIRVYAPMGAAAVVAFSLGLQQRPQTQQVAAVRQESLVVAKPAQMAAVAPASQAGEPVMVSAALSQPVSVLEYREEPKTESITTVNESTIASAEQLLQAGTATVMAAGQALAQVVGLVDSGAGKSDPGQLGMAEPLAQLSTPRDSRRTRLFAYAVAYDPHAAGSQDSARSRDRIARRISDESIYDSITRLGVSGDRVSIKF